MSKKATPAKKAKAPKAEKAAKVSKAEAPAEHKASEVIAPVPIALLEEHPSLPSAERWLTHFSEHYVATAERHSALETKAAPAPEPEPQKTAGKKQRSPFMPPTLPGAARPVATSAPVPDLAWRTPAPVEVALEPEPEPEPEPVPESEPFPEPEVALALPEVELEEAAVEAEPEPTPAEAEPEFDLFAQLAAEEARVDDPDDFLARLTAQGEAAVDGRSMDFEETGFTGAADPSSPFIAPLDESTTMIAALSDEDEGTTMIAAVPDDEPFAEPNDSTTMIAAITDEDLENLSASSEEGAVAKGARKSRKASKKKKG